MRELTPMPGPMAAPPMPELPRYRDIPPQEGGPLPEPARQTGDGNCYAGAGEAIPGYARLPYVAGFRDTPAGPVPVLATALSRADRLAGAGVRWGIGRSTYRVPPGLYAVGEPSAESPVLVTANYKLTVDALRQELAGVDAWVLVADTKGVNVWCAAGKKTFSALEVATRVSAAGLSQVVSHRRLILPQLAAPGVSAREVKRLCGFSAVFGPVRAADVPRYLASGQKADPAMRRVSFTTAERMAVAPVEFKNFGRKWLYALAILFVVAGIGPDIFSFGRAVREGLAAFVLFAGGFAAGTLLTPLLLPWLPGRALAAKGAAAGLLAAPLLCWLFGIWNPAQWVAAMCGVAAVASWFGMNYTGSTTYTSPSGVEREMRLAMPLQIAGLVIALALWVGARFFA